MAAYTIRVELHNATWQDYVNLQKALAAKGIVDVIKADTGVRYKMPPAEYNYEGVADIDAVLNTARAAANSTGRSNAVLVTQATARKWVGLEQVK